MAFKAHPDITSSSHATISGGKEALFYLALAVIAIGVGVPAAIATMLGAM
ncbi:MAG: hypothetical protein VX640_12920 [Pseudomonadota bacterium]|nr:hypothetical protein [Pseudomonadota bacterium]